MAYTANLHITFDASPLFDAATATVLTAVGGTPTLVDAVYDKGWQMDGAKYAYLSAMNVSAAFTLGFYLKPSNPGMVTNPLNGNTESLLMPVVSRSNFSYSSHTQSATSQQFIIYEATQSDGTNKLYVSLKGATTSLTASNSYTANKWHYFWIVYNGATPSCTIYIDLVNQTAGTTGTIPASLSASSAPFAINWAAPGSDYQLARNLGTIDDLVGFTSVQNTTTMARAAQYGALYVADSDYANREEIDNGLVFDDAETVQINAIANNKGRLYVARSDGRLLRGSRTLWQSRNDFNTQELLDTLNFVTKEAADSLHLDSGELHIHNEIVKL
jgi:hypothetical protein